MKEILSNLKGFFAAFHAESSDYSGLRAEALKRDCDLLRVYDGGEMSYLVLLKGAGVTARLETLDDVNSGNVFDKCNFAELFDAAKKILNGDDD